MCRGATIFYINERREYIFKGISPPYICKCLNDSSHSIRLMNTNDLVFLNYQPILELTLFHLDSNIHNVSQLPVILSSNLTSYTLINVLNISMIL